MTDPSPRVRRTVIGRDLGWCHQCGQPGHQVHHRRPRQMGGTRTPWINRPANLVLLCEGCHRCVELGRLQAARNGYLIPMGARIAEEVPIWGWRGWLLLDDNGGIRSTAPPEDWWQTK